MNYLHEKTFPNESIEYRKYRDKLLHSEIKLRKAIEEVAELRRGLPMGGKVTQNYEFDEIDPLTGSKIVTKLSGLFRPGKDTLAIYSFMFAPEDEKPCTSCNSIIDGLNGSAMHINDRVNLAIAAKSPAEKLMNWAYSRNWKNIRLLSSFRNSYNKDYHAENESGSQLPALNIFHKTHEGIFHFYNTELLYVVPEEGEDARHVDMIWPLWNLLDLTPEGRGKNWYPKHDYC